MKNSSKDSVPGPMFNFSANMEIEMHWWILQNVSKIIKREFSMKSSRQATRKKSFTKTVSHSLSFC